MKRERVLVMGAAGRDFHNFNVCFRHNPSVRVVAFTAAQIPFIANRRYPASLAGPLYPRGIPVYDEALLPELIVRHKVNRVIFAYSDISHKELMHRASLVLALGADFSLLGPTATMVKSSKPVISVCAVRTGCGKSQVTRYLCRIIRDRGLVPVVVRHPMPYGDLARQEVERFGSLDDLARYRCSIEEREEYEPLLRQDVIVYAGVDYVKILHLAEREGDVLLWDGGNNDFPFYIPNLEITIVDPLRSGDETEYYPGEVNLRRADVIIINKSNAVAPMVSDRLAQEITRVNATARIIKTDSVVSVADSAAVAGKSVLVVEDGPSVTHGGLISGAGHAAAVQFQARQIVDPRPFAFGSLVETYRAYPHIGQVLPAMGYSSRQVADLRKTIERTPCDLVIAATPIDLRRLMPLSKPLLAVTYDIREVTGEPLQKIILQFLAETSH
jgi:predicted GTPase